MSAWPGERAAGCFNPLPSVCLGRRRARRCWHARASWGAVFLCPLGVYDAVASAKCAAVLRVFLGVYCVFGRHGKSVVLGLGLGMLSLPRGAFGACGHRSLSVATLVCLKQLDDGCVNPTHWPPATRLPLLLCFFFVLCNKQVVRVDGQSHGEEHLDDSPVQPQVHRGDSQEAGEPSRTLRPC